MTDFEQLVVEQLGEIKATGAATAATLTALNQRLFDGPASVITVIQTDIVELKADVKTNVWLERGKVSLGPILVVIHAICHHLGLAGI